MTIPFRGICFASAALALFSHCAAADQESAAPKATASEPTASEVAIPAATAPEAVVQESDDSGLSFNAGADLRIRQEIMDHVPGNPYGGFRAFRFRESGYRNHIRFRPRVWARASWDRFTLFGRLVNEFREHIVKNGTPRKHRGGRSTPALRRGGCQDRCQDCCRQQV